eukprot:1124475-Prymnesium_polylepis.1
MWDLAADAHSLMSVGHWRERSTSITARSSALTMRLLIFAIAYSAQHQPRWMYGRGPTRPHASAPAEKSSGDSMFGSTITSHLSKASASSAGRGVRTDAETEICRFKEEYALRVMHTGGGASGAARTEPVHLPESKAEAPLLVGRAVRLRLGAAVRLKVDVGHVVRTLRERAVIEEDDIVVSRANVLQYAREVFHLGARRRRMRLGSPRVAHDEHARRGRADDALRHVEVLAAREGHAPRRQRAHVADTQPNDLRKLAEAAEAQIVARDRLHRGDRPLEELRRGTERRVRVLPPRPCLSGEEGRACGGEEGRAAHLCDGVLLVGLLLVPTARLQRVRKVDEAARLHTGAYIVVVRVDDALAVARHCEVRHVAPLLEEQLAAAAVGQHNHPDAPVAALAEDGLVDPVKVDLLRHRARQLVERGPLPEQQVLVLRLCRPALPALAAQQPDDRLGVLALWIVVAGRERQRAAREELPVARRCTDVHGVRRQVLLALDGPRSAGALPQVLDLHERHATVLGPLIKTVVVPPRVGAPVARAELSGELLVLVPLQPAFRGVGSGRGERGCRRRPRRLRSRSGRRVQWHCGGHARSSGVGAPFAPPEQRAEYHGQKGCRVPRFHRVGYGRWPMLSPEA